MKSGNLILKVRRGRLRIVTNTIHPTGKMGIKSVVTEMIIDIRTEVYPNVLVFVYVVSVAGKHLFKLIVNNLSYLFLLWGGAVIISYSLFISTYFLT